MSVESPFSGPYAFTGNADLGTIVEHDLSYGSRSTAARRRMELYRGVGLRVTVGQDMEISLAIAEVPVSENDRALGSPRSPAETP